MNTPASASEGNSSGLQRNFIVSMPVLDDDARALAPGAGPGAVVDAVRINMGAWCGRAGAGGWLGVGGWIGMVAIWVVVVALVVWGVSRLFPTQDRANPRATLDRRLARGEIDRQTYRAIREELDGTRPAGTSGPGGVRPAGTSDTP